MTARLAWAGIAVLAAYAIFVGGSWFGQYLPQIRLVSITISAIVIAIWAWLAWRSETWRPRSRLLPVIVVCIASLALSTVTSRYPLISVEYVGYAVVLGALYLLLTTLMAKPFFRQRLVTFAMLMFALVVVLYVVRSASHWISWWSTAGTLTLPPLRLQFESVGFGNPSTLLTIVALLAIPVAARADWATRRGAGVLILIAAIVGAVALLTGSRAGWLALAIAGLVAIALSFGVRSTRDAVLSRARAWFDDRRSRAAAVVLAGVLLVTAVAFAPTIIRRAAGGGESNRIAFVEVALRLFSESPVVGTGPGTWVIQRPAYTMADEPDEYIPHAHNIYAQTLAELGLAGAAAGIFLFASLFALVRGAIRAPDPVRRRWGWATCIGLVYLAAHQLLDFYANFPAVLLAAAIPVAYLDATAPATAAAAAPLARSGMGRPAAALALGLVGVAIGGLALQEGTAIQAQQAVDAANGLRWGDADAPAREAAAADPRIAPYLFTAGLTASHAGDHAAAADFFRRVVATDDYSEAWLNLAAEEFELGHVDAVVPDVQRALRLGRQRLAVTFAAGELALRAGDRELAIDTLASAVARAPSLIADPWWSTGSAVDVRAAVVALASQETSGGWEVLLMAGDGAGARTRAATSSVPYATDFVDAWAGDETAAASLVSACDDLANIEALNWCARVAGHRGDQRSARRFRDLAAVQAGGTYEAGAELRLAGGDEELELLAGAPAIWWGTYSYGRFTPSNVLVPTLMHLKLA